MISVNGEIVPPTRFPDGTQSFKLDLNHAYAKHTILWKYDDDAECIMLWNIVHHIRSQAPVARIVLVMPYIPNARMDRVKNQGEIFTLKWFAEFINTLCFDRVEVFDVHSNVATALIDRVVNRDPQIEVSSVIDRIGNENLILCFPDEGAAKRYSGLFYREYVFGIKHRDWETGRIERLEITTPEKVCGRDVLIVDDICSRGGTFTFTAKALKEAGAGNISLYVSHCEDTILSGSVLTDGLITHVFTTDSIFHGVSDKITVL